MPRAGLNPARVTDAAVAIADADGLEALTLARVAADLGVRPPSLYNHVAGREALVRAVAVRALDELAAALRDAALGRAGADALQAMAAAYRTYARAHPGRYASTLSAPEKDDAEHEAAARTVLDVLVDGLRGLALDGDDAIHAVRAIRSALHGFVALEAAGGFGLPVDLDASYDRLVDLLAAGLGGA